MTYSKVKQHSLKFGKFSVRVTGFGTKPIPLGKMNKSQFLELANRMRQRSGMALLTMEEMERFEGAPKKQAYLVIVGGHQGDWTFMEGYVDPKTVPHVRVLPRAKLS